MNRIFLFFFPLFLTAANLTAQEQQSTTQKHTLTLDEVVQLAKDYSPRAIQARHRFRASYFSFMDYKATFLPKLTLTTNPTTWDKSIRTILSVDADGKVITREARGNTFTSSAGLALSQNIGFTGGSVSLGSEFQRIHNFLDNDPAFNTQFTTNPIRLSLNQPLNGYNRFRWDKEIEPLRYEEAKLNYTVAMEDVASMAVNMFFNLAIAQETLKMMEKNLENQKELYNIATGRYANGLIAEDALLTVQLRYMRSESSLNNASVELRRYMSRLLSFLGFNENVEIELIIEPTVPSFKVDYDDVMNLALTRNPEIIAYKRQILEAERAVAQAKSQTGITLNLDATFGTNRTGFTFGDAYSRPFDDREGINLRINIPILDWSQNRNRYRNAQSMQEVVEAQIQQAETDFKQDIFLEVMRFNMQENQLHIAMLSDTIAQASYEISLARYTIGRGDITVLNIADTDKDDARIGYMRALMMYWTYFYNLRSLTLFDFLNNRPLEEDFEDIIGY